LTITTRKQANQMRGVVQGGKCPNQERRRERDEARSGDFEHLAERYLERQAGGTSGPRTPTIAPCGCTGRRFDKSAGPT
jgi:hypothetical protein